MPMAPPRPCNAPGCAALTQDRFCPDHARERERAEDRARGTARGRGYDTRWDKTSRAYLARHPFCLGCRAVGLTRASEVTDHILPFKGDERLKRDPANWQPACRWHHDIVKARLEREYARGEIGAEELRLDSARAVILTRQFRGP